MGKSYVVLLFALLLAVEFVGCAVMPAYPAGESNAKKTPPADVHPAETDGVLQPGETAASTEEGQSEGEGGIKSAEAVGFPACMSNTLPEGLTAGEFDEFLGNGGGVPLINAEGTVCGYVELHFYGSGIFERGALVGVTQFNNHASFDGEFTPVSSGAPCVAVKYSRDAVDEETGQFLYILHPDETGYEYEEYLWYAFWAKEGFSPFYAICLYANAYNYEDLIAIAKSVTFSEGAFVAE